MSKNLNLRNKIENLLIEINDILDHKINDTKLTSGSVIIRKINIINDLDYNIIPMVKTYIRGFDKNLSLYKDSELEITIDNLKILISFLNNIFEMINNYDVSKEEKLSVIFSSTRKLLENSKKLYNLEIELKDSYTNQDIAIVLRYINNNIKSYDTNNILKNIAFTDEILDLSLVNKLIDIYNICTHKNSNDKRLRIFENLSILNDLIDLNNKKNEINDQIIHAEEILKNISIRDSQIAEREQKINENFSIATNSKLLKGYSDEVEKISKKIFWLNIFIVILFILIISLFVFKFFVIYGSFISNVNHPSAQMGFFENPWNLLSFFTLILSFSALLTYLIKDRARLIKLHDHFNLNKLELIALPEYMGEFESQQRIDLYISLAPNYFRGVHSNVEPNPEIQKTNIEGVTKVLDSVSKFTQDIKGQK